MLKVTKTKLEGVLVLEPKVFGDNRGYFLESHNKEKLEEIGIKENFTQDNISKSTKGVLRGLHYQAPPFAQGKLVQVIQGSVLDVVVDIRHNSPTYGEYFSIELNGENKKQLWVPPGFAHGFLTLSEEAIFHYKCSAPYNKESERGIIWNDPDVNVHWGTSNPILSDKDKLNLKFSEIKKEFTIASTNQHEAGRRARRVLITGGAGFIGSNFIKHWLKTYPEDRVVNLDALTYAGNPDNLLDVKDNPNYRFIEGSILDDKLVNALVRQVDLVVHFAAESHVDRSIDSSTDFIKTNIEGTHILLEAAKNNGGVRFHHISTDEVFGHLGPNDEPFNEFTKYDPRSPYSASKAAADHLVRAYHKTYNLPITISNCSNNYGPNQYPEKLHGFFITNLLQGKKMPLYGDGMQVRDWLYVSDHCKAIDKIIHKGKLGETYLVGGDCEKTNLEIARIILRLVFSEHIETLDSLLLRDNLSGNGISKNLQDLKRIVKLMGSADQMIEYVKDRPGHDRRYAINTNKIKQELNWQPEVDFEEGMKRTVDWYKSNKGWWEKLVNIS